MSFPHFLSKLRIPSASRAALAVDACHMLAQEQYVRPYLTQVLAVSAPHTSLPPFSNICHTIIIMHEKVDSKY